ncbi:MAG: hypothetical protein HY089_00965 [Ignavibacteriales bacterium]|nr:hypothetical protein [Ignavibacteriales bacterium]
MKTYEIGYKLYYGETSDAATEYIKAKNRLEALRTFARNRELRKSKFTNLSSWQWEEGVWRAAFKYVKEVRVQPCPHCGGTGEMSA